jgi:hypothetical protein
MTSFLFALACTDSKDGQRDSNQPFFGDDGGGETEADADTDSDSDTDADTDSDSDADTDTKPYDCKGTKVPSAPLDSRMITGTLTAEDIAIDNDGYIIGSDRLILYRSDIDGHLDIILPEANNPQALVVLQDGDIYMEEESHFGLVRISPSGDFHTVSTDYYIPYGDAAPDGTVYFSALPNGTITGKDPSYLLRVDPSSDEVEEIMEWKEDYPWGISFNEDHTALYVSVVQDWDAYMSKASRIFTVPLDDDGYVAGDPELYVTLDEGAITTEGLAVDACGNLYVSLAARLFRVPKGGGSYELVWEASSIGLLGRAAAGLEFGRGGAGGTDPLKLYASDPYGKEAVEIDAGIGGNLPW